MWLYGGGELLSQLLDWDLVDTVEPAIIPIVLGDGVPMLAKNGVHRRLNFIRQQTYPSGMVLLEYEVQKGEEPADGDVRVTENEVDMRKRSSIFAQKRTVMRKSFAFFADIVWTPNTHLLVL